MKTTKCLSKFDPTRTDCHASNTGTIPVNITFFGYKSDRFFWRYCNSEKIFLIKPVIFWFHESFQKYINYRPVNSTVDGLDASSSLRNITLSFPNSLQYDMMLIDWFDQKNHKNWGIFEIISKLLIYLHLKSVICHCVFENSQKLSFMVKSIS